MSQSNPATHLAPAREQGSLRLAYRKSVVALQQAFGWKEPITLEEDGMGENDPLLNGSNNNGEGSSQAVRQGGAYGSVLDLPPDQRVPRPKKGSWTRSCGSKSLVCQ